MRVAHLANPQTANGFYRGVGPMMRLAERGHYVVQLPTDEKRPPVSQLPGFDVLHIHRYCDARALQLVRAAKTHGMAVVWDNDDDMGSLPKGSVAYKKFGGLMWERRLAAMRSIFRVADLVTSPSSGLSDRLRGYGAERVVTLENFVPRASLTRSATGGRMLTVGWVAGLEHQHDLEVIPIRAVLQRLLDEHPDLEVVTIGLGLGLSSERYRKIDKVPVAEISRHTATFDIGIAPLADTAFNRARSDIKLKEYAAGGAPWLASPVGPYAGLGEREGGRLVADDGWYDALSELIARPRMRGKLAKRAVKWVAGQTLEAHAERWEKELSRAVERARTRRA